ncbi:hypothetical protein ON010_g15282 [Phytophthora cinnamomi]|nr:hypothetical protein ON010_g15282 [Phytophthora cinnamomi]
MLDRGVVTGMEIPVELFKKKFSCMTSMGAKRKRMLYKASAVNERTKITYERLMSDVCDMQKYLPDVNNYRCFQLIQDEGSRYKWVYPLKNKSDSNANSITLMPELLAQGHKIKTFTSGSGGRICKQRTQSIPETLRDQLNGVLANKIRVVMHAVDLPEKIWPEVLQYVVDIDNMNATRALKGRNPSEKLFSEKPDISKIRHLWTGKIVEARDVQFREDATVSSRYLNKRLVGRYQGEKIPYEPLPVEYIATDSEHDGANRAVEDSLPKEVTEGQRSWTTRTGPVRDTRATGHGAAQAHGSAQPLAPGRRQLRHQRQTTGPPPPATRVSSRVRTPNVRLRDYQLMVEEKFVGDPATVKEALSSPQRDEWWAAMQSEYDALLRNNTWKLIDPPKSLPRHPVKILTSK